MTIPIDYFSLDHKLRIPASKVSLYVRKKIFRFFIEIMQPGPLSQVIDIGVTPDNLLPESNFFERLYPYRKKLTVTSIEDASILEKIYPGISFIKTEKYSLPFKDNSFDYVFCSAVVEHVGNINQQKLFIKEVLRISKNFFFTTPNRMFPVEFHTILPFCHWLPQFLHQRILQILGLNFWAKTENLNLLTVKSFRSLFPANIETHISKIRLLGLSSNLIAYGSSSPP